jgi:hypothetical protein
MSELHLPHAHHDAGENPSVHHEASDINIRAVFAFGLGLIVVGVVVSLAVYVLFGYFTAREGRTVAAEYPLAVQQGAQLPPEPRLQIHPREDLQDLRASEAEILGSYGWVDKNTGIVRIPIDEAMKLTLQRGLPARENAK